MLFFLFTKKANEGAACHSGSSSSTSKWKREAQKKEGFRGMGHGGRREVYTISKSNSKAAAAGLPVPVQRVQSPKSNQRKILNVPRRELCRARLLSKIPFWVRARKPKIASVGWASMPRLPTTNSCSFSHTHTEKFSGLFQCWNS